MISRFTSTYCVAQLLQSLLKCGYRAQTGYTLGIMSDEAMRGREPLGREFLERRNELWAALRRLEPSETAFENTLTELSALIGWNRDRILAGLGLTETEAISGPSL